MLQPEQHISDTISVLEELNTEHIERVVNLIYEAWQQKQRVFIIGNGGSQATSAHLAEDLMLGLVDKGRQGVRTSALDSMPAATCLANDTDYEMVYRHQLATQADLGDILVVISGSGRSANVVIAARYAKTIGMATVAIVGFGGGDLKNMCDMVVHVRCHDMEVVENAHMVVCHLIVQGVRLKIHKGKTA